VVETLLLLLVASTLWTQEQVQEDWRLILLGGKMSGYSHQLTTRQPGGRLRTECYQRLGVDRFGQRLILSQRQVWLEAESFLSLDVELSGNGAVERLRAEAAPGGIRTLSEKGGAREEGFLPASPTPLGPFRAEQELLRAWRRGDSTVRTRTFSPDWLGIQEAEVSFLGRGERSDGAGGIHRGTIAAEKLLGAGGLDTTLVIGEGGEILYTRTQVGLGLETVRTPPPTPEQLATWQRELDSSPGLEMSELGIPVSGLEKLSLRLGELKGAVFVFSGPGTEALEEALRLAVAELGDGYAALGRWEGGPAVTLSSASTSPAGAVGEKTAGAEAYLRDGYYLALNDPRLEAILAGCGSGPDPECLRQAAYRYIRVKSARFGFAGTQEILSTREGDCTEHSLLLSSLLRRTGVPARLAYGFLLTRQGFTGHAWTEAFLDGRWVWLDASFPSAGESGLKLRLGTIDPAQPLWGQMGLALLQAAGAVRARLVEARFE